MCVINFVGEKHVIFIVFFCDSALNASYASPSVFRRLVQVGRHFTFLAFDFRLLVDELINNKPINKWKRKKLTKLPIEVMPLMSIRCKNNHASHLITFHYDCDLLWLQSAEDRRAILCRRHISIMGGDVFSIGHEISHLSDRYIKYD